MAEFAFVSKQSNLAKKSLKKVTKQLAPEAGPKQSDRVYPAEPHELNGQRQRLKNTAAVGADEIVWGSGGGR